MLLYVCSFWTPSIVDYNFDYNLPQCGVPMYRMHRQPEHVMTFLLAEMGTSGSLDGQQRLVVKGRFAPKNFEGILRRYISNFLILCRILGEHN